MGFDDRIISFVVSYVYRPYENLGAPLTLGTSAAQTAPTVFMAWNNLSQNLTSEKGPDSENSLGLFLSTERNPVYSEGKSLRHLKVRTGPFHRSDRQVRIRWS